LTNSIAISYETTDTRLFLFVTIHALDRRTDRISIAIPCVAYNAVAVAM